MSAASFPATESPKALSEKSPAKITRSLDA
jgi:hypothetical protein